MLETPKTSGTVRDSENPKDEAHAEMDNQQEILKAWLACAFDCEGTIGFNTSFEKRRGRGINRPQILPLASISNTSWQIIKRAGECFKSLGLKYNLVSYQPKGNRHKPAFILSCVGAKRVGGLLPLLIPYLTEKLYLAESVMAFIESRKGKERKPNAERAYTDHELRLVQITRRNSSETTRATPIQKLRVG